MTDRNVPEAESDEEYDSRVLLAIASLERQGKLPATVQDVADEMTRLRVAAAEEAILRD